MAIGSSAAAAARTTIQQFEVFETGIKVIDVLVPLERGGKAGLFGGAGVGKTVLLTEMIDNMIGYPVRRPRSSGVPRSSARSGA